MSTPTTRPESLLSVTLSSVTNLIRTSAAVADKIVATADDLATITNQTSTIAKNSNGVWAARIMSDYTAEEREYLAMLDENVKLPALPASTTKPTK